MKRYFKPLVCISSLLFGGIFVPTPVWAEENTQAIELQKIDKDNYSNYDLNENYIDYYAISNADELYYYAKNSGTYTNVVLTADIVLNENLIKSDGTVNKGEFTTWTPITASNTIFDGNYHTISGMYYSNESGSQVAMFKQTSDVQICNLGIVDSYFYGNQYVASFSAYVTGTESNIIENCYSTAIVKDNNSICGGIVSNIKGTLSISNSYYYGNATSLSYTTNSKNLSLSNSYCLSQNNETVSSGELCYLLNSSSSENPIYYQKIGTDAYPNFKNNASAVVYYDDENKKYYNTEDEEESDYEPEGEKPEFLNGCSLSLKDTIGINFYVWFPESYLSDNEAKMVFQVPNGDDNIKTYEVFLKDTSARYLNGKYYHCFSCDVSPKDITREVTATLSYGEYHKTIQTSVEAYVNQMNQNASEYSESTLQIANALLNYGKFARVYFDKGDNNGIITEEVNNSISAISEDDFSDYDYTIYGNLPDHITYEGSSLILSHTFSIRHYFKIDSEQAESIASQYGMTPKNQYYYIEIDGILPQNLSQYQWVTLGTSAAIRYSVLSYGKVVLNAKDNTPLENLMKSMLLYSIAAQNYVK